MLGPVGRDAVPDRILHDQKPDLLQRLSQRFKLEAEYPVLIHLDIGTVVEYVQGAVHIDFQRRCDVLGLRLALLPQKPVQVPQDWHLLRARILQVVPVHQTGAAVNDGFLNRGKPLLAPNDKVAQGKYKITFQRHRVFIIRIVQVDVHWVDIVGGIGGNVNHLPLCAEALHQGAVLILRICNDDVVLRQKEHVDDLTLGREGLAAARRPQEKPVGVL